MFFWRTSSLSNNCTCPINYLPLKTELQMKLDPAPKSKSPAHIILLLREVSVAH